MAGNTHPAAQPSNELHYHFPESVYASLGLVRDELDMLAGLAEPTKKTAPLSPLSVNTLIACFERLSDQLTEALDRCQPTRD